MFKKILLFLLFALTALLLRRFMVNIMPEYLAISLINLSGSFLFIYVFSKYHNRLFLIVFCGTFTTFSGVYNIAYQYYQEGLYFNSIMITVVNLLIIPLITFGYFRKVVYQYE